MEKIILSTNYRIEYLDSIRGIAALVVVIFHANMALSFTNSGYLEGAIYTQLLNIFFNGHNAVNLFFVLSGFVLSFKYINNSKKEISYLEFLIKRAFRIYPVYWCVLFVVILYTKVDILVFIEELFLIDNDNFTLLPPSWSLIVEVRMSLIFLFLLVLALRNIKILFIAAFLYWFLFGFEIYILHFCLGILLALNFEKIQQIKWNKTNRYLLFFVGFLLCSFKQIYFIIFIPQTYQENISSLGFFFGAFGCTIWLILVLSAPHFQQKLERKSLLFLGKISYGIYISHVIFINNLEPRFDWFLSQIGSYYLTHFVVRYFLVILLTLLFSTFLYYVIEKPFIKIGQKVAKKYNDKLVFKLN